MYDKESAGFKDVDEELYGNHHHHSPGHRVSHHHAQNLSVMDKVLLALGMKKPEPEPDPDPDDLIL